MTRSDLGDPDEQSTLLATSFDPSPLPDVSFELAVIEGPDAGKRVTLDGDSPLRLLVGTSSVCELRLTDKHVSRRHAALDFAGPRLRIRDLGSTNGTFVDGVAIAEAYLLGGELVRVGSSALSVERVEQHQPIELPYVDRFGLVIGQSTEMRRLYPLCQRLAESNVPVVIEGETGTGKEFLAESLHQAGPRAGEPFVVFDCTAVPPSLIESELFGHERGAFTGAVSQRRGVLEQAHGGTLLIDEIGDLDLALQPKLLRALERGEARRLGGERAIRFDVRILCATRRNLDQEVQAGRFRDDLFHRLAVARIELPPLRHRRGDVSVLARHFCRELGGRQAALTSDILRRWEDYAWPGNVRELRNAVARQLALGTLAELGASGSEPPPASSRAGESASSDFIEHVLGQRLPLPVARQKLVEHFERLYIERVLADAGGNVGRAAEAAGLARRYFTLLRRQREKG